MKKLITVTVVMLFYSLLTIAQSTNKIWCFGDSAGLDFNFQPPIPIHSSVVSRGSCASICNGSGMLIFYVTS